MGDFLNSLVSSYTLETTIGVFFCSDLLGYVSIVGALSRSGESLGSTIVSELAELAESFLLVVGLEVLSIEFFSNVLRELSRRSEFSSFEVDV